MLRNLPLLLLVAACADDATDADPLSPTPPKDRGPYAFAPDGYPEADARKSCPDHGKVLAQVKELRTIVPVNGNFVGTTDDWDGSDTYKLISLSRDGTSVVLDEQPWIPAPLVVGDEVFYGVSDRHSGPQLGHRVPLAGGVPERTFVDGKLERVTHDGRDLYLLREVTRVAGEYDDFDIFRRPILGAAEMDIVGRDFLAGNMVVDREAIWLTGPYDGGPADAFVTKIDKETGAEEVLVTNEEASEEGLGLSTMNLFHDERYLFWIGRIDNDGLSILRIEKATGEVKHLASSPFDFRWRVHATDAASIYVVEEEDFGDCCDGDGPGPCCPPGESWVWRVSKLDGSMTLVTHLGGHVADLAVDASCVYLVDAGEWYETTPLRTLRAYAKP